MLKAISSKHNFYYWYLFTHMSHQIIIISPIPWSVALFPTVDDIEPYNSPSSVILLILLKLQFYPYIYIYVATESTVIIPLIKIPTTPPWEFHPRQHTGSPHKAVTNNGRHRLPYKITKLQNTLF